MIQKTWKTSLSGLLRAISFSSSASLTEIGGAAELDRSAQKRAIEIKAFLPHGFASHAAVDKIEAQAD